MRSGNVKIQIYFGYIDEKIRKVVLEPPWFLVQKYSCSFDGDLMDGERILEWLTSQDVFETKDEIEEVNRKMLEKLLDENEFVAVYFCMNSLSNVCHFNSSYLDEDNCLECDEAMEGLEKIDDETDALDITFVKVNDPRWRPKWPPMV